MNSRLRQQRHSLAAAVVCAALFALLAPAVAAVRPARAQSGVIATTVTPSASIPIVTPSGTIPIVTPSGTIPIVTPSGTIPIVTPSPSIPIVTPSPSIPIVTPSGAVPTATPSPSFPIVTFTPSASPSMGGGSVDCAAVLNHQVPACITSLVNSLSSVGSFASDLAGCAAPAIDFVQCAVANLSDPLGLCGSELSAVTSCINSAAGTTLIDNACATTLGNAVRCSGTCSSVTVSSSPSTCEGAFCLATGCINDLFTVVKALVEALGASGSSGDFGSAISQGLSCFENNNVLCVYTGAGLDSPSCSDQVNSVVSCLYGLVGSSGLNTSSLPPESAVADRVSTCLDSGNALVSTCA